MKIIFGLLLLLAGANFSGSALAQDLPSRPIFVDNCYALDGDTIRCDGDSFRLNGIDTAEMPGHCAEGRKCAKGNPFLQRKQLARIVNGRPLKMTISKIDKYGRGIANIYTMNGKNVSCLMIGMGAQYKHWWDDNYQTARDCPRLVHNRRRG